MGYDKNIFGKKRKDRHGYPVDKEGNRIEIEEHDVPMYRAYGKHRVYRPWLESLINIFIKSVTVVIVVPFYMIAVLIVLAMIYYMQIYPFLSLIVMPILLYFVIMLYIKGLRVPRCRMRYYGKLKRFCRKKGYKLEIKRSALRSLFRSKKEDVDLHITAGDVTYNVKFLAASRKLSDMTFYRDGKVEYRVLEQKRGLSNMLGLRYRNWTRQISFPTDGGETAVNAIVTSPDPKKIYKGNPNSERLLYLGSETVGGYKIFTSDGFIYTLNEIAVEKTDRTAERSDK